MREPFPHSISQWVPQRVQLVQLAAGVPLMGPCCPCHSSLMCASNCLCHFPLARAGLQEDGLFAFKGYCLSLGVWPARFRLSRVPHASAWGSSSGADSLCIHSTGVGLGAASTNLRRAAGASTLPPASPSGWFVAGGRWPWRVAGDIDYSVKTTAVGFSSLLIFEE